MRSISENDLSVVIPLLAAKIRQLQHEIDEGSGKEEEMSDEEFSRFTDTQDILVSNQRTLDNLIEEYSSAVNEGIILPGIDSLLNED